MTTSKVAALTGRPGVGKTTAVIKVLEMLDREGHVIGGFYTREIRSGGVRKGFEVYDIMTGKTGMLASTELMEGPMVGRYRVNIREFEEVGVAAVQRSLNEAEMVLVDEVGPMELFSKKFVEVIEAVLSLGKPSLMTVHMAARHPLAEKVRRAAGANLYVLTPENRDTIPTAIYGLCKQWLQT